MQFIHSKPCIPYLHRSTQAVGKPPETELEEYLKSEGARALSPTMPLTEAPYQKEMMFPVFDGLIPEGWLLDIAQTSWKINARDRMSLLLACCKDCIGDIGVIEVEKDE